MKPIHRKTAIIVAMTIAAFTATAQEITEVAPHDSTEIASPTQGGDRNVMLNAQSANSGPRNVNIGLPASVGGTTVLENGLPVVYFFWPEMPHKAWRMDGTINDVQLYDLARTAIEIGDVGFSVSTYDNLGTDRFRGNIGLNSNHFGLLNGAFNLSGPISKNGLKFSVGGFLNFDPGTYSVSSNNIDRYYNDNTKIFKAALTKDYTFGSGTGTLSLLYKFVNTRSMTIQQYAPYIYHLDGSVSELDNFRIGRDNYMASQKLVTRNAETGEMVERDALDDFGSTSHTIDLIGKNTFNNGLNLNYIVRYHDARGGNYVPLMTGTSEDNTQQYVMLLGSVKVPIRSLTSLVELGKKSGNHNWRVGLNQWNYGIDRFRTESMHYSQNIGANPTIISGTELYDRDYEYHNGTENKTALFFNDTWDISRHFTLNVGARLEYQNLRGDYINHDDIATNTPYLSSPKTDIKRDWLNKNFHLNLTYKITPRFGLLTEAAYLEQAGHLENYSAGYDLDFQKSSIPVGSLGLYYNHPYFSLVSKATLIKRGNNYSTINFNSASGIVQRTPVSTDIETLGWTTDVLVTPFEGFNLHLLFTLQDPKYKNYSGTVNFSTGESVDYNFNNNYVTGISKTLIEIDPSYQWKDLRIWASARYFSKTYANLTNSLTFKGRWETFAGANYTLNKHLEFSATVINLLNQRGAQGTIMGADLYTDEQAANMEGRVLSGNYIRPFTVEFGMKYNF